MTGWHYTSYENWLKIKKTGLIPYHIPYDKFGGYFPDGVAGIWTWYEELTGKSEVGTIIWQVATKQCERVVKLKYEFDADELLEYNGGEFRLPHTGEIGNYVYHKDELARIIIKTIPPERIELVQVFKMEEAWQIIKEPKNAKTANKRQNRTAASIRKV